LQFGWNPLRDLKIGVLEELLPLKIFWKQSDLPKSTRPGKHQTKLFEPLGVTIGSAILPVDVSNKQYKGEKPSISRTYRALPSRGIETKIARSGDLVKDINRVKVNFDRSRGFSFTGVENRMSP
jgi:hypothetical protein